MSVESVSFIAPGTEVQRLAGLERTPGDFATWFEGQMNVLNRQIDVGEKQIRSLATGESNNLHQVMISLEKANRSFQLVTQVRNKVLEAYRDIMRMQI